MLHHVLSATAFVIVVAAMVFREGRSDRADLGWLVAAVAAAYLAVVTEQTLPRARDASAAGWDSSRVIGEESAP